MAQALLSLSQNSILHVLRYSLDGRLDRGSCGGRLVYPPFMILTGQVVENVSVADRPNSQRSATLKVSSSAQKRPLCCEDSLICSHFQHYSYTIAHFPP